MKRFLALLAALLLITVTHCSTVYAVPNLISYQGVLNDSSGSPVSSTVNMTFRIYDAATDGNQLWTETQSVQVASGGFNVKLGSVQQLSSSVFQQDTLYLGIQVGSDPEMVPRQQITSGSFSYKSEFQEQKITPIGSIIGWAKSIPGVPALPDGWVECNGQVLEDADSPINGKTIPNLNGANRFLRGGSSAGETGGSEMSTTSASSDSHQASGSSSYRWYGSPYPHTHTVETIPPYYTVVWIIKIK